MPTCPICERPIPAATAGDTRPLPFCSPRCKLVDLDNWLGGRYVVAQALPFSEESDLVELLGELPGEE